MRFLLTLILLLCFGHIQAQVTSLFVNDNLDRHIWEENFSIRDQQSHGVNRPYRSYALEADSSSDFLAHSWSGGSIRPVALLGIGAQYRDSLLINAQAIAGVGLSQDIGKRISLDLALYGGMTERISPELIGAASDEVYPGITEFSSQDGTSATLWDANFSLRYQASDIFSLELGKGKNFFGSGYRSLLLSDNAAAYPYLRFDTKIWHIQYTNLFSQQQGKFNQLDPDVAFENKYTATHLFSWNVSPKTNIHLFESIVWQAQDSLSQRGFDVRYLNPIIFYRPVEFAAGSADNALIGFGLDYKLYPSYVLYTQFIFDEFLLDQFMAGDGWWANKYGVLLGIKGFDAMGVEGLYLQAELTGVRPFTYSHGSPTQNYAHLDQALAHPLGANFYEALVIGAYEWDAWELRNHLSYTLAGRDSEGRNLGGDIFRSYASPFRNLGNYVGQGAKLEAIQNSLYFSRIFDKSSDSRLSLAYHFRYDLGDVQGLDQSVTLSFRTSFGDGFR